MADASLRVLGPGDEAALTAFLAPRADSSLFLISNLARAGIIDTGAPLSATYVGRFADGDLAGVVAHCWNGNMLVQAPAGVREMALFAAAQTGRRVAGFVGPWEQALAARQAPEFRHRPIAHEPHERLYALALNELRPPEPLVRGDVLCRRARMAELDQLAAWRVAYSIETLGENDCAELRARASDTIARGIAASEEFVLEQDGALVAMTGFNAGINGVVQIGGVWTPMALRKRGYARAAVAGQLSIVRAEGAHRAVLFTQNANMPAQRAYESIGFAQIGEFGLIHFTD